MLGELKSFSVNNKKFMYQPLSPLEALPFCMRVGKAAMPVMGALASFDGATIGSLLKNISVLDALDPEAMSKLSMEALKRCITPDGKELSNEAVFNLYFSEHPDELLQAGVTAMIMLSKDFFPKELLTQDSETNS